MASNTASKRNGWKKIAFIATTIVAVGAAATVLEPYAPWAPKVTFSWAAESILSRYHNQLVDLRIMEAKALDAKDHVALRVVRPLIADVESKIEEVKAEKAKRKK